VTKKIEIEPTLRHIFHALSETPAGSPIDDIPISKLNIDSLDFFDMIVNLEDEHGIIIPVDNLSNEITLRELISVAYFQENQ
jgi:acyl carrier protein